MYIFIYIYIFTCVSFRYWVIYRASMLSGDAAFNLRSKHDLRFEIITSIMRKCFTDNEKLKSAVRESVFRIEHVDARNSSRYQLRSVHFILLLVSTKSVTRSPRLTIDHARTTTKTTRVQQWQRQSAGFDWYNEKKTLYKILTDRRLKKCDLGELLIDALKSIWFDLPVK